VAILALFAAGIAVFGLVNWGDAQWYYRSADYRLRQARTWLHERDWDRAEEAARGLDASGAQDAAHLLRGEALLCRAEPGNAQADALLARALEQFDQIRDRGEIRLDAAALAGQCLLHLKHLRQAEQVMRFVLSERPDDLLAHRTLAALYYDQGAFPKALVHLREVGRLDPIDGRAHRLMGLIERDLSQYNEAVPCYEEALRRTLRENVRGEVHRELAECLIKLTRYADALAVLEGDQRAQADSTPTVALRAECLWGLGRGAEARALLDGALAGPDTSPAVLCLRAKLHQESNELAAAAALLERAVALDPHDVASRYQLAQTYERLGRPAEAAAQRRLLGQTRAYFEELTKLNQEAMTKPWDAAVRRRLAEVSEKLGRHDLAQMWRKAAAACDSPGGRGEHEPGASCAAYSRDVGPLRSTP
jgi:tetratricopeptide (TPR) repeat protein